MKKIFTFLAIAMISSTAQAQTNYTDSMKAFQLDYVLNHEVVIGKDKQNFKFFRVNPDYRVTATLQLLQDSKGFLMKTSGKKTPRYFKYARLSFQLDGKTYQLTAYQNEDLMKQPAYKDMLFVPFTDLSSGEESYAGGRYIEFYRNDIINNTVQIDFNKAYNPYCVYASGYNCPIPPRENDLNVAIRAGERNFSIPE